MEHRGIGGTFFDDLSSMKTFSLSDDKNNEKSPDENNTDSVKSKLDEEKELNDAMTFTKSICDAFMPSYLPIVRRRRDIPYTEEQRHWQLLRRGRYIEFNLLYDRGVKFGLVPGGKFICHLQICPLHIFCFNPSCIDLQYYIIILILLIFQIHLFFCFLWSVQRCVRLFFKLHLMLHLWFLFLHRF